MAAVCDRWRRLCYARVTLLGLVLAIILSACQSTLTATSTPTATLKAPTLLIGDIRVHDPAIIEQDGTYYVFSTGQENGLNGGTIQIRKSSDLAKWVLIGTVWEGVPGWITEALGSTPPNLWAPDITYFNGKYYLYYAGSRFGTNNSVIGLATNTTLDPRSANYKWVDEGLVIRSTPGDNWNAIDPNLSFDAAKTPWLSFGSFWDGIKMRRIDPNTGKLAATDKKLYALASRGGGPIEAPAIVFRDGYYYLFVSFDFCCRGVNSTYKIMVGRSKSITGPYVDNSGKPLSQGGGTLVLESKDRYRGPGGQTVYRDDGVYRLAHHVYDTSANGAAELQIHDLAWTNDGWPRVAEG